MFEIRVQYQIGKKSPEECYLLDHKIYDVAGRTSEFSSSSMGFRDHGWVEEYFDDALSLRRRLTTFLKSCTLGSAVLREQ